MKLVDRQPVEGTTPTVYIGHQTYPSKNGTRKVSKKWYAEYNHDGQQRWQKLGTPNKGTAIKLCHALCRDLEHGSGPVKKRKVELADLVAKYIERQTNKGRAPKTIQKYEYVLGTLVTWAKAKGKHFAGSFTSTDYWAFNRWMEGEGLGDKTRYDRRTIVSQLFIFAVRTLKVLPTNPIDDGDRKGGKPESKVQPCFEPEQVGILLAKADPHESAMFAVMAYAGLRFGEVRDLLWTDLNLKKDGTGFIHVQRGGSGDATKGKRSRQIPVHPELRKVIDKLPKAFGLVFTARPSRKFPEGGNEINERRLLMSLKRLCRRCKFPNPNQYKLHTFRHVFASSLARNNISYKYALDFMGHKSSAILDLYYKRHDPTALTAIGMIEYPRTDSGNGPTAA